jgi:hypothetical protein
VRIIPGQSLGDTVGFSGASKGAYAKAEFYNRRDDASYARDTVITLVNPMAPVDVFVNNRGTLILLDNWHNKGYGTILALYAANGSLIKSYKLSDLFSNDEIEGFDHSESSIIWRKGPAYIEKNQSSLYVMLNDKGTSLTIDAREGAYQFCEWRDKTFLCRSSNTDRHWVSFKEIP